MILERVQSEYFAYFLLHKFLVWDSFQDIDGSLNYPWLLVGTNQNPRARSEGQFSFTLDALLLTCNSTLFDSGKQTEFHIEPELVLELMMAANYLHT